MILSSFLTDSTVGMAIISGNVLISIAAFMPKKTTQHL